MLITTLVVSFSVWQWRHVWDYAVVAALPCAWNSGRASEARNSGFTFGFVCQVALCDAVWIFCTALGVTVSDRATESLSGRTSELLYQAEQLSHCQAEQVSCCIRQSKWVTISQRKVVTASGRATESLSGRTSELLYQAEHLSHCQAEQVSCCIRQSKWVIIGQSKWVAVPERANESL
jgi:hypothetical protein